MQSEVFLSSQGHSGRTIALRSCPGTHFNEAVGPGHVLNFALHNQPSATGPPQVSVRLESALDPNYRRAHSRPVYGCLGLMHHANDTFIALVTGCVKVGDIRYGESVCRIIAVKFFSLSGNTPDEDMIPAPFNSQTDNENDPPSMMPHPCRELEKVLCNGAFFFSPQFDLTRSIQTRALIIHEKQSKESNLNYDERFLWNMFMLKELQTFRSRLNEQERGELDSSGLLIHITQGYVGSRAFRTATTQGQISVISRLGSKRAGTRFNTRGIDDNGNVANFVETETIISNSEWCFSYTQLRGSVPVFWEQQGLQLASHKIQISRGSEATKPAVKRHFEELIQQYEDIHILDLLGTKDQGEITLSQEYKGQVEDLAQLLKQHLHMTKFDFHSQIKGGNHDQVVVLLNHVRGDSERYGYFFHDLISNTIIQTQRGVFRTNCLDCLDRTNVIQNHLSKEAVEYFLHNILPQDSRFSSLMLMHSELWADNGDLLSKIYTGTGALKSDVTRSGKMSFAGILGDATKSLNRFVINNFQDKDRQEVIDLLLGKMTHQRPVAIHDPVHDSIASEMKARLGEYSQKVQIDVFVGTYNLNGKLPSEQSLDAWLCFDKDVSEPDMYVIGFQEIVELTARQIAVTDENKRRIWEREIEKTINRRGGARYIQLRSVQLVGAALMIYVKEKNVSFIRNVECTMKKTGLRGMAGNKGAIAIRMDYFETSLCLVTAHLASGQDNLQERNDDYQTIDSGIAFARGRNIAGHDIIVWCGDFNYRVDMENDQIRALVSQGNYFEIFKCDQLKRSIDYDEAFYGYKEGIITFAPTYRYDIGTNRYDSSEKYRAPAWTDRILYRGRGVYQTSYERADLRISDHRPVMSMFVLELTMLDAEAKENMEQSLYRKSSNNSLANGSPKPNKDAALGTRESLVIADKPRNGHGDERNRMPPGTGQRSSTDKHQWWNDPLEEGVKRIPSNNRNPFEGDQTIFDSGKARSVPPTPAITKPAVDLLGDLGNANFDGPRVQTTGGATGNSGKKTVVTTSSSAVPTLLDGKKSVPPIPPTRHKGGVPIVTLATLSTIHKDKDAQMRRPAPPPPNRRGAVSGSRPETDDDDDGVDNDDNDNNDGERATSIPVEASPGTFHSTKDTKRDTDGKVQDPSDQEVLLKPSQLKQQQKAHGGLSSVASGSKAGEAVLIKPGLSAGSPVPLATVAANRSKVSLPGFNQLGTGPSVALVGLNTAGNKTKGAISDQGISVVEQRKGLDNKPSPSLAFSASSPSVHSIGKEEETDRPAPSPSVTDLKKSFTAGSTASPSKGMGSPSPQKTTISTVSSPSSGHAVAPVIPMVKPLSFSTTVLPTTSTLLSRPALGPNPSKVKVTSVDQVLAGSETGTETETKDVKPASGSVKQAIAALKAGAGGEAATLQAASGMSKGSAKEEDEEEKVDAFAFWKGQ